MNDLESGERANRFKLFGPMSPAFSDESVRQNFIKKVYWILTSQLLLTFKLCLILSYGSGILDFRRFAKNHSWLGIVAGIAGIILFTSVACSQKLRTENPNNFIIIYCLITVCQSFAVSFGELIFPLTSDAMFIICGIAIGLAILATRTEIDFSFFNRLLLSIFICLVMAGITFAYHQSENAKHVERNEERLEEDNKLKVGVLIVFVVSFLISLIIFLDTQRIFTKGRYAKISPEEPVFAALVIYFDICIFIFLLYGLFINSNYYLIINKLS